MSFTHTPLQIRGDLYDARVKATAWSPEHTHRPRASCSCASFTQSPFPEGSLLFRDRLKRCSLCPECSPSSPFHSHAHVSWGSRLSLRIYPLKTFPTPPVNWGPSWGACSMLWILPPQLLPQLGCVFCPPDCTTGVAGTHLVLSKRRWSERKY